MENNMLHYWITVVIVTALVSLFSGALIGGLIESNQSRREIDGIREQLSDAADTNTRLEQQLNRCRAITANLEETIGRDVDTIRGAVEIVEELRTEIGNLEECCNSIDWDSYYNYWDTYYGIKP